MQRYVIQPYDTLYKIAQRFGITISQLIEENPQIRKSNMIYAGETIYLPGYQYIAVQGDTLYTIAHLFGISVSLLIAANPQIFNANHIAFGQRINIPRIPITASKEEMIIKINTDDTVNEISNL